MAKKFFSSLSFLYLIWYLSCNILIPSSSADEVTYRILLDEIKGLKAELGEMRGLKAELEEMRDLKAELEDAKNRLTQLEVFNKELLLELHGKSSFDYIQHSNQRNGSGDPPPSSTLGKRLLIPANSNGDSVTVAFTVVLTHDMTLGPHQAIEYNKILTNIGNGYDSRHGHFTAPTKGIYMFSVTSCSIDSAIWTEIMLNGVQMAAMYGDHYDMSSHTIVLLLEQNDSVWVRNLNTDRVTVHAGSDRYYSSFTGILISLNI